MYSVCIYLVSPCLLRLCWFAPAGGVCSCSHPKLVSIIRLGVFFLPRLSDRCEPPSGMATSPRLRREKPRRVSAPVISLQSSRAFPPSLLHFGLARPCRWRWVFFASLRRRQEYHACVVLVLAQSSVLSAEQRRVLRLLYVVGIDVWAQSQLRILVTPPTHRPVRRGSIYSVVRCAKQLERRWSTKRERSST